MSNPNENVNVEAKKIASEKLGQVAGGIQAMGVAEFENMNAENFTVGECVITPDGSRYICKAKNEAEPTADHYWCCESRPGNTPKVIFARPKNSNE